MPDEPTGPRRSVDSIRCSFCGKPRSAVASMVAGPTPSIAICNECVDLCAEIVAETTQPPPNGPLSPGGQAA
ncbi:MAG TPA: ClpX C4-type zinc finger protein [Solirubrobacteraceae bacterium]|nr:ClpX C4-type zinc finger protein [Solirubrobacteraceae bacterium]